MRRFAVFLLLAILSAAPCAMAREAAPMAKDPVIEARLMALAAELRCLVCQNQTLADSHADLAEDLRNEIRELMQQGMTDEQVVEYLVARYGDFVRYRPPFKPTTALLWFGPLVLVGIGGVMLWVQLLRRRRMVETPLSDEELQKARKLLENGGERKV